MYARRVAEAVELAKARARSIMNAPPDATPVELATAGTKPKAPHRARNARQPADEHSRDV
jgi:hypothetical protein